MIKATFTIFTGNSSVAKGYDIKNSKVQKIVAHNFYKGSFETVSATTEELEDIVKSLRQGQFLTSGVHQSLVLGKCPNDAKRKAEEFIFPNGPGLLILDGDSLSEFGVTSAQDYVRKLTELDGAIKPVGLVCSPSASSGILFKGKNSGLRGLHCFMLVDKASEIPCILETLHKRSILAGWSRAQITASGTILIKSLVDLAMKTSNQPCFEGGARLLNKAIAQEREIEAWEGNALCAADIKQLTADELANYDTVCEKIKAAAQDKADEVRAEWLAQRELEMVEKGSTSEQAKKILDKVLNGGTIFGDYIIHTDKLGSVSVKEILADPAKYHDAACADPVDPGYGQNKAKIYCNQGKPCIHSVAHGGSSTYFLHKSLADEFVDNPQRYTRVEFLDMIETNTDFVMLTETILRLVSDSELKESEREVILKAIAKKSGCSVAILKKDLKQYVQTDSADNEDYQHLPTARLVINAFGNENLIDANGFLWCWRGDGVWRQINDREVKQKIHEVSNYEYLTSADVNSVLDMVKTESHKPNHRFDENPQTINCANGELTYMDGGWELLPHEREHYRTAILPVAYDPNTTAPRFEQFLSEVFDGDSDAVDKTTVVMEALGYTLVPSCHLEKFFMLIGSGANGKSVLLAILKELVGRDYTSAVQPSQFENQFQRGHLHGKLANIITEIAEGAEIADAQLKSLVSGEMTTAEHKHKDPFEFVPFAKHWFGTNHLPHTRDFSDALFRRANILTFNNKFEGKKCDVHLINKLKEELPGILNLALTGLQRLFENNAFSSCASSVEIADQWRREADQVSQFVEEACVTGKGCRSISSELYRCYKTWADNAGIKRTVNRNNFTNRLKRLHFEAERGTGGTRMISGVKPKGYAVDDFDFGDDNFMR